ncbi:antitoxin [Xanthomonas translucens pv. undulosa]|uniref:type II toxin-antitoxin system RelB family antitoxin n=1 Tax=Xanthomonas campestris pv. translucens TaxID=343 RepID=UPI003CE95400
MTKLDPRVSEFKSTEAAESYDRWFRAKIERAMADMRPAIPLDHVMARARARIEAAANRQKLA